MTAPALIFFGDSITAGAGDETGLGWVGRVVDAAAAAGLVVEPHNFGVPGDTSSQVVARWERQARGILYAGQPAKVVFSFGANDTLMDQGALRVSPEQTVRNLDEALTRAAQLGFAAFVVGPTPVDDPATRQRAIDLSALLAAVSASHDVPYVDIAATIDASELWRGEVVSGDGAHPASGGYALLAGLIAPALLAWLADPT